MSWESIVTSIGGVIVAGIIGYIIGRKQQHSEHKYQEEKEKKEKAEAEKAWLDSIQLNKTQKEILQFCRDNPSERYNLQGGDGTYWLVSVDKEERTEFPDMTVERQFEDMIEKGYISTLSKDDVWRIFELTKQGREIEI